MTWRINGCGTTMSPHPSEGEICLSVHWVTVIFIPIIPLGWHLIEGGKGDEYYIHKKTTWKEAIYELGAKGMCKTMLFAYFTGGVTLLSIYGFCLICEYFFKK